MALDPGLVLAGTVSVLAAGKKCPTSRVRRVTTLVVPSVALKWQENRIQILCGGELCLEKMALDRQLDGVRRLVG